MNLLSQDVTETIPDNQMAGKIYLFFATAALIMFYYAHAPGGAEKLFYIPCAGALIASFFCHFKRDCIDVILLLIIGFSLLSDLVNFTVPDRVDAPWLRQCIGILCFNKLRKFNMNKIVTAMAVASPFIILSLYLFSSPFGRASYRYGGFSGDPNYLAISLNLLIVFNLLYIHRKDTTKLQSIVPIITILGTLPLFIAGKSRAGLIAMSVLLLSYLIFLFFNNRKTCFLIIAITFVCSGNIYILFQKPIDAIVERFDSLEKAHGGARVVQFSAVNDVYKAYPYTFPLGTGIDNSPLRFEEFKAKSPFMIHNTYLNILFGQGFVALCLYLTMFWLTFKQIWKYEHKGIFVGLYLSLLLNISSVASATYLTFWWTLFFLLSVPDMPEIVDEQNNIDTL